MNLARYNTKEFDRGASRFKEILWVVVKCVFFLPPWPMLSSVRVFWLRLFGAKIGHGVVIRSRVNITFPWRFTVGDHVWLGEEAMILNLSPVTIESSVCVSQRAFLCTGSHDFRREDFALKVKPIVLRSGCWVAAQTFVGPGVEIGSGAVLSAGSVTFKDIPAHSLAQGNPARVIEQPIRQA
jgi:putative colanic acid biosynthesis acetyltransferase WcaF